VLSAFFIARPRFAIVISLVVTLAGVVAMQGLPIDKFPEIAPPTVKVTASYPGASAKIVEQAVATPIETEVNGVKNMIYMESVAANDGSYTLTVTFEIGTDADQAAVEVQNRVARATPRLPQEVRTEGVKTEASSPNMLLIVNLVGDGEQYDGIFLNNYLSLYVKDAIARVPGVGSTTIWGARDYGMRIWIDPDRLRGFDLRPGDLISAIQEQNIQIPAGRLGGAPALPEQRFQLTVGTSGRLDDVEEFERIVIRANPDGSMLRVADVARVELGAQNYDMVSKFDGEATSTLVVFQRPGSNALAVKETIESELDRLSAAFPEGLRCEVAYDTTRAIEASIAEVVNSLLIAVVLVILVVFVFLADLRATVVPAVAVPVSLVGTFAFMAVLGFSINLLTLFGLILAIGIVVDDAIVVVETTTRNIDERGMAPKDAARAAMEEVFGAVIASTLVLYACFVPVAFMPGLTGRVYNQFALTIVAAVTISTLNAITLSPALAGLLLRPSSAEPGFLKRTFDRVFEPARRGYVGLVRRLLGLRLAVVVTFFGVLGFTVWLFGQVPGGFVPTEDEGAFLVQVQLPDASSLNRSEAVVDRIAEFVQDDPAVAHVISVAGFNLLANASSSSSGLVIATLRPWDQRGDRSQTQAAVVRRMQGRLFMMPEAIAFAFEMPPIPGLGNSSGVEFILQDRGGKSLVALEEIATELQATAIRQPAIASVVKTFRASVPQLYLDVDRIQARTMGVRLPGVVDTLTTALGSRYVNDFNLFGRTFRVMMSAERPFTRGPDDLLRLFVSNDGGDQVSLSTFAELEETFGPETINRFNIFRSVRLTASPAPGFSSGQAIGTMEALADATLSSDMGYEWAAAARQEKEAGGASIVVFALAFVLVYLFLVAQYESFTVPLSVLMAVPTAVLGALLAQWLVGLPIDVFAQVGLVLLVGLTAKTAILFVELAKQRVDEGSTPRDAMIEAAHSRFRSVLMTALTFLLGMLPLLVATGAGANSRRTLGTAVFGGTAVGIVFTLLFVPVFYVLLQSLRDRIKGRRATSPPESADPRVAAGGE